MDRIKAATKIPHTKVAANGQAQPTMASSSPQKAYRHVAAVHYKVCTSCLSHDSDSAPSFLGFRNLMVLVLVVMNLRLVVENFMKYGVLICIRCHDYRRQDIALGALLYALVPCHLFIAYVILLVASATLHDIDHDRELAAAQHAKGILGRQKRNGDEKNTIPPGSVRSYDPAWQAVAVAHGLNATLCLLVTTVTVFFFIHHPMVGTVCELHAIIVWLKNCSYAFTNRDLRHASLHPHLINTIPKLYAECPYPRNITLTNLVYFWWAPTLVYQPVYPRTATIRWIFVGKRLAEVAGLSVFIWLASAQYAAPLLRNSLNKLVTMDLASILERLMKLSTISLIIWLAGFFAVFQSMLNALAEIMRFGDREFYTDWWNSPSVGTYWRTWNKPVNAFMRRHIYSPLIGRGWNTLSASTVVFIFSGLLHELLVGIPTHNLIGVAFVGMVIQVPLIIFTLPLEKMEGIVSGFHTSHSMLGRSDQDAIVYLSHSKLSLSNSIMSKNSSLIISQNGKVIGNCVFWISFCLVGQPLAALLYFFAWQAKYGSISSRENN